MKKRIFILMLIGIILIIILGIRKYPNNIKKESDIKEKLIEEEQQQFKEEAINEKLEQEQEKTTDEQQEQIQEQTANEEQEKDQQTSVTKIVYGKSVQGRDLEAYLIKGKGNNSKTIFLDFEVHRI